ncbi:MAG: dihydrolipoamide acetyltransferase family protein [Mastigocoleus sp.]
MSINEVFMPALSSTMTEGKIVSWVKSPGDKVEKGETVVVVESDKADMDVESFYEGYLAHIIVEAGETATVGNAIALLAETEAEIEEVAAKAKAMGTNSSTSSGTSSGTSSAPTATSTATSEPEPISHNGLSRSSGRIIASPRAKKLAKQLKVDLSIITGSGPHGRIVAQDIESAAGKTSTATVTQINTISKPTVPTVSAPAPIPAPISAPTPVPTMPGETVPLNTLQQAVVRGMEASLAVPVFRVGYTITTDALDKLYKQIKPKGVTMTALLAKAVAVTLQKHPIVNASYSGGNIVYHPAINIAVAVAMDDGGLITPVLQNADQLDIYTLSRNWKSLVQRARAKQLQPDEYSSGTFTLSNLGMFGVDKFDAILPPGQGSILAIGAARPQLVASQDGTFGIKQQMQVNITSDHRIIYGAHAAAFLKDLAQLIETDAQSLTM